MSTFLRNVFRVFRDLESANADILRYAAHIISILHSLVVCRLQVMDGTVEQSEYWEKQRDFAVLLKQVKYENADTGVWDNGEREEKSSIADISEELPF